MKGTVWGSTQERANEQLDLIYQDYLRMGIKCERSEYRDCGGEAIFENGDVWIAVNVSDKGQHSHRCNISYIDSRLNFYIIRWIIMPSTNALPFNGVSYF